MRNLGTLPASALKISAAPTACTRPPIRKRKRPTVVSINSFKLAAKGFRFGALDFEFVFRTAQAFLVVAFDGFADRIRNVGRNALDLFPAKALDDCQRQPRLVRRPTHLLLGAPVPAKQADG